MRHARGAGRQGPFRAAQRGMLLCGSGQGGEGGPPGPTPDQQRRALGVLSGARQISWKQLGDSLGGTLIVDNASHKEDVQKVGSLAACLLCNLPRLLVCSCSQPRVRPPFSDSPTAATRPLARLQAMREGTLSFGFSAGGCLFPYYIGCAGALMDAGILTGGRHTCTVPWLHFAVQGSRMCWRGPGSVSSSLPGLASHPHSRPSRPLKPPCLPARLPAHLPACLPTASSACRGCQAGRRLCRLPAGRLHQIRHAA